MVETLEDLSCSNTFGTLDMTLPRGRPVQYIDRIPRTSFWAEFVIGIAMWMLKGQKERDVFKRDKKGCSVNMQEIVFINN
jgi:hypothetical protein